MYRFYQMGKFQADLLEVNLVAIKLSTELCIVLASCRHTAKGDLHTVVQIITGSVWTLLPLANATEMVVYKFNHFFSSCVSITSA